MDIYDQSPSIPMRDGWSLQVSGHAIGACRFRITDNASGGWCSIIYDPLGKMRLDGVPAWEIYPIYGDAAAVELEEDLIPWIERALEHSLQPQGDW